MIKNSLLKWVTRYFRPVIGIGLVLGMIFIGTLQVSALPQDDIDALNGGWIHWKVDGEKVCGAGELSAPTNKNVYFLGDSIGTQVKASLGTKLGASQYLPNVLSGRNLGSQPPNPSGLVAIDQDQDFIKGAGIVVIELGTNTGGFSASNVDQMVSKIRSLAPNAQIYWVDTAVVQRADYAKTLNGVNGIIYAQSKTNKFQVISWNKKVFGSGADPLNINPNAPDNGFIRRSDQFVHLTNEGISAMVDVIASTVNGGGSTSSSCCATLLAGNNNIEKVWNFLVSKGLTPPQAAGIMGNLQAESHFDPAIEQRPGAWEDMSNTYNRAVGLAQWDGGRRVAIIKASTAQGKDKKDLGFQLEYLYQEALGRGDWDRIKKTLNAADSAFIWHKYYEVSADSPARIQGRANNANAILAQYGSGSPAAGSSKSSCGAL